VFTVVIWRVIADCKAGTLLVVKVDVALHGCFDLASCAALVQLEINIYRHGIKNRGIPGKSRISPNGEILLFCAYIPIWRYTGRALVFMYNGDIKTECPSAMRFTARTIGEISASGVQRAQPFVHGYRGCNRPVQVKGGSPAQRAVAATTRTGYYLSQTLHSRWSVHREF